jgi:hypothetical protein
VSNFASIPGVLNRSSSVSQSINRTCGHKPGQAILGGLILGVEMHGFTVVASSLLELVEFCATVSSECEGIRICWIDAQALCEVRKSQMKFGSFFVDICLSVVCKIIRRIQSKTLVEIAHAVLELVYYRVSVPTAIESSVVRGIKVYSSAEVSDCAIDITFGEMDVAKVLECGSVVRIYGEPLP